MSGIRFRNSNDLWRGYWLRLLFKLGDTPFQAGVLGLQSFHVPGFLPGFLRQVCQLGDNLPDLGRGWRHLRNDAGAGFGVAGRNRSNHYLSDRLRNSRADGAELAWRKVTQ